MAKGTRGRKEKGTKKLQQDSRIFQEGNLPDGVSSKSVKAVILVDGPRQRRKRTFGDDFEETLRRSSAVSGDALPASSQRGRGGGRGRGIGGGRGRGISGGRGREGGRGRGRGRRKTTLSSSPSVAAPSAVSSSSAPPLMKVEPLEMHIPRFIAERLARGKPPLSPVSLLADSSTDEEDDDHSHRNRKSRGRGRGRGPGRGRGRGATRGKRCMGKDNENQEDDEHDIEDDADDEDDEDGTSKEVRRRRGGPRARARLEDGSEGDDAGAVSAATSHQAQRVLSRLKALTKKRRRTTLRCSGQQPLATKEKEEEKRVVIAKDTPKAGKGRVREASREESSSRSNRRKRHKGQDKEKKKEKEKEKLMEKERKMASETVAEPRRSRTGRVIKNKRFYDEETTAAPATPSSTHITADTAARDSEKEHGGGTDQRSSSRRRCGSGGPRARPNRTATATTGVGEISATRRRSGPSSSSSSTATPQTTCPTSSPSSPVRGKRIVVKPVAPASEQHPATSYSPEAVNAVKRSTSSPSAEGDATTTSSGRIVKKKRFGEDFTTALSPSVPSSSASIAREASCSAAAVTATRGVLRTRSAPSHSTERRNVQRKRKREAEQHHHRTEAVAASSSTAGAGRKVREPPPTPRSPLPSAVMRRFTQCVESIPSSPSTLSLQENTVVSARDIYKRIFNEDDDGGGEEEEGGGQGAEGEGEKSEVKQSDKRRRSDPTGAGSSRKRARSSQQQNDDEDNQEGGEKMGSRRAIFTAKVCDTSMTYSFFQHSLICARFIDVTGRPPVAWSDWATRQLWGGCERFYSLLHSFFSRSTGSESCVFMCDQPSFPWSISFVVSASSVNMSFGVYSDGGPSC